MAKLVRRISVAFAITLSMVVTSCASRAPAETAADVGVTKDAIKIGSSMPYSGPLASFGQYGEGAKAYFNYVNANGGVNGRKIDFTVYDDAGAPARTVQNVNRLVEQDKVFALAFLFGTASNLAVRDSLNAKKIPNLYGATGYPGLGSSANIIKYPWTIGWIPPYSIESAVDARYLEKHNPTAKVAILYQNDDLGTTLVNAFEHSIKGTKITVVSKQPYNVSAPSVSSQVTALANSRANVFLNLSQGTFASQAVSQMVLAGWHPTTFIPSFATSTKLLEPAGLQNAKGFLAPAYLKEPSDPQWASDPGVLEYQKIIKQYGAGADPLNHNIVFGFTEAELLVKALKGMAKPTRASLMDSARSMHDVNLTMLLPGINVNTGPKDGFPLETVGLQQFDGRSWHTIGDMYDFEGKSDSLTP